MKGASWLRNGTQYVLLLVLVSAALLVVFAAVRFTFRANQIDNEIEEVEKEIAQLQEQKKELENSLANLEELEVIEQIAREKLNLKKEDEQVVILLPEENGSAEGSAPHEGEAPAVEDEQPEPSNPMKWWAYFFGE